MRYQVDETEGRICRKCLVREATGQADVYRTIKEYIDNLDSNIKADDLLYESRLGICKECEMLLTGMCRSCGCYVEMRAIVEKNGCPRKKW